MINRKYNCIFCCIQPTSFWVYSII